MNASQFGVGYCQQEVYDFVIKLVLWKARQVGQRNEEEQTWPEASHHPNGSLLRNWKKLMTDLVCRELAPLSQNCCDRLQSPKKWTQWESEKHKFGEKHKNDCSNSQMNPLSGPTREPGQVYIYGYITQCGKRQNNVEEAFWGFFSRSPQNRWCCCGIALT